MDILKKYDLVTCKKEGVWCKYKLNFEKYNEIKGIIAKLTSDKHECICKGLKE